MKNRILLNSFFYGIAVAMSISIVILSFFMSFSCEVNLRYFIVFLAVAVLFLSLAGINSIEKQ